MHPETNIGVLQSYTDDQWQTLLTETQHVRGFGRIIIVPERAASRRELIAERLAQGVKKGDIARELGVSPGLISKILSGERC